MKGAFVTYSNEAKIKQGVPADIISTFGVYSPETAAAMARVCRDAYAADFAIGITGTFGNIDPGQNFRRVSRFHERKMEKQEKRSFHVKEKRSLDVTVF